MPPGITPPPTIPVSSTNASPLRFFFRGPRPPPFPFEETRIPPVIASTHPPFSTFVIVSFTTRRGNEWGPDRSFLVFSSSKRRSWKLHPPLWEIYIHTHGLSFRLGASSTRCVRIISQIFYRVRGTFDRQSSNEIYVTLVIPYYYYSKLLHETIYDRLRSVKLLSFRSASIPVIPFFSA